MDRSDGQERQDETPHGGYHLLELLKLAGWEITITAAFAGGVLVVAARMGLELKRTGESVAALAPELFQEAVRFTRRDRLGEPTNALH